MTEEEIKITQKIMLDLTDEQYETLVKAQTIWEGIANRLDNENALSGEDSRYFDDMNVHFRWLLDRLESGFECK